MSFLNRKRPLGNLPRFGELSDADMRKVCDAGREVHVPSGWSLLHESTAPDQVYLVIEGDLAVTKHGEKVADLHAGDIVGELAVTGHKLRTATVTTTTETQMLHLTSDAFKKLYDDVRHFREAVDKTVAERTAGSD